MQTQRIGIFGRSGTGKSTLIKSLITPANTPRLIIFDPEDEYGRDRTIKRLEDIDELIAHVAKNFKKFRVCYVPSSDHLIVSDMNKLAAVATLIQKPFKNKEGGLPLTFLADEVHRGFPLNGEAKCPEFSGLCTRGRKSHIHVIGASQRLAMVGMSFRTQMTQSFMFAFELQHDFEAAVLLGYNEENLKNLVNYQYINKKDGEFSPGQTKK